MVGRPKSKGFHRRTLCEEIKSILQQYPDDGQIFKEIIQNAEDAGATEVIFVYDKNNHQGKRKLSYHALDEYQGPCLYTYNDGKFEEDDWKGISSLGISGKVKDPLKVGRFGLGFKSVFHLTDIPCITSGSRLVYLDPLKSVFTESDGVAEYDLSDPDYEELLNDYQDFECFHKLGKKYWNNGETSGSLFRFSLRQEASFFSSVCYDSERFEMLISKFLNEAYLPLIFLKNIKQIKMYVIEKGSNSLKQIYSMSMSADSCVQKERQEFCRRIKQHVEEKKFSSILQLNNEIHLKQDFNNEHSEFSYIVSEHFGYNGENQSFLEMMQDEELSYVPLIAVALPVGSTKDSGGHIFSALPLPLQKHRMTGMPVHVNGFFALGQDRKDLKWATLTEGNISNDKTVNWNKCLIKELLPLVYSKLIQSLVNGKAPASLCYDAWPIQAEVDQKWHMFLECFYGIMLKSKCIYVDAKQTWVSIQEAVFMNEINFTSKEDFKAVKSFMERCGQNVASVPGKLRGNFDSSKISLASGDVVCSLLRNNPNVYPALSFADKKAILNFVMKSKEDINCLFGLPLFPLVNQNLVAFSTNSNNQVYLLVLDEARKKLLPTNHYLIDSSFFDDHDSHLSNLIKTWASKVRLAGADLEVLQNYRRRAKGIGNVKLVDSDETVIEAVHLSAPASWKDTTSRLVEWPDASVSDEWLSLFLCFAGGLRERVCLLEDVPLIPVAHRDRFCLWKLSKDAAPMLVCFGNLAMAASVESFLRNCGVCFVNCPLISKEDIHQLVLHEYLIEPEPEKIMMVLNKRYQEINSSQFTTYFNNASKDLKNDLCKILVESKDEIPSFFRKLSFFHVYKSEEKFASAENCHIADINGIPNVWSPDMFPLIAKSSVNEKLVTKLGMTEASFFDVCKRLIPFLSIMINEDQLKFFDFILSFNNTQSKLPTNFVSAFKPHLRIKGDAEYLHPSQLFVKTDLTTCLFLGEKNRFPNVNYDVKVLLQFGLRDHSSVTAAEINVSAKVVYERIVNKELTIEEIHRKVEAILDVMALNQVNPYYLAQLCWIPISMHKPSSYPSVLPWLGGAATHPLTCPKDVYSNVGDGNLIGSTGYVIEPKIADKFNNCFKEVAKKASVGEIFRHLDNVQKYYTDEEKGLFKKMVYLIYHFFAKHPQDVIKLIKNHDMAVWQGHDFIPIEKITLTGLGINIEPYYYTLPTDVSSLLENILITANCQHDKFYLCVDTLRQIADQNETRNETGFSDLQLSMRLVRYLAESELENCLKDLSVIHVPVEGNDLKLYPATDCYYIEKTRSNKFSSTISKNKILHRELGKGIADKFKIPSLISKVLGGKKSKFIKPWGQTEPLTLRLKRLLEEYQDGLAIIKELVQNADDAGASKVKLLYDKRSNNEMKDLLIDNGMKDWQGPAIWVYNNQTFTESDFENITKINAGSKEFDTKKIGKFGLGFNSVYHLTDVPSFLSSDSLVIFDPHAVYLGEALESKDVPGIRVPLSGDLDELISFKHQFEVFNGIFGANFDFSTNQPFEEYKGTLFRLPLRKSEMAEKSEIKNLEYSDNEVKKLLEKLEESLDDIILFTENVRSIEVWEWKNSPLESPQKLFSVKKTVQVKSMPADTSIIEIANRELQLFKTNIRYSVNPKSIISQVDMEIAKDNNIKRRSWLTISTIGSNDSFRFAVDNRGHLPCGAVSIPIDDSKFGFEGNPPIGKVFCFLPLPMESSLPVHVNGAFSISRNREGLKSHSTDEKDFNRLVNWNDLLGKDLSQAYLELLTQIPSLYPLLSMEEWVNVIMPRHDQIHQTFAINLTKSLIEKIMASHCEVLPGYTSWKSWGNLRFLEGGLPEDIQSYALKFMNWYYKSARTQNECVSLPSQLQRMLNNFGFEEHLKNLIITRESLYKQFLRNIADESLDIKIKDKLLDHILDLQPQNSLKSILMETECIPTNPRRKLRKPSELVKAGSKASKLYTDDDEVFSVVKEKHFPYLSKLGMHSRTLPWIMLIERAKSVEGLERNHVVEQARDRSQHLFSMMIDVLENSSLPNHFSEILKNIRFLEVMQRPYDTFFHHWYADADKNLFAKPSELYTVNLADIVSCSRLVSKHDLKSLNYYLLVDQPSPNDITQQLKGLVAAYESNGSQLNEHMSHVLCNIYKYIDSIQWNYISDLAFVKTINQNLAVPAKVFEYMETEVPGFLFKLDPSLSDHRNTLRRFGVRTQCKPQDYVEVLSLIYDCYQSTHTKVPDDVSKIIVHRVVPYLLKNDFNGQLYLPDDNNVMRPTDELCYKDDCQGWLPEDPNVHFLHEEIARVYAQKFGIKSLSADMIMRHPDADELWCDFGQKEKLTTRIKNLLKGYAEPEDVFKEMLQNADDAGATEIEFVLDERVHKSEKIFSTKWKPLQGPALLVCNNGTFMKRDLQGIQNLGVGSKREDPLTTGKYGVGFNAVYGITDCPVMLTPVKDFDDVLCIFDPNRLYAEGATEKKPGRMLKRARQFLEPYTDVKTSFLFDKINTEDRTLFRFPLRTKEMVSTSKISDKITETHEFRKLLGDMKKKANDILLFLKSISKVTFTTVQQNGKMMRDTYIGKSFDVKNNEYEQFTVYQNQFLRNKDDSHQFNSHKLLARRVCVQHYMNDDFKQAFHWEVVEQCGFSHMNIDQNFKCHFRDGLKLIPKGGIAKISPLNSCICCEKLEQPSSLGNASPPKEEGLFCTLPLPVKTGFPAIINGNFILDYETRRDLKKNTQYMSVEVMWNENVLKGCVLPCYLHYMLKHAESIEGPHIYKDLQSIDSQLRGSHSNSDMRLLVKRFYEDFPRKSACEGHYWQFLSEEFFKAVYERNLRLLIVQRKEEIVVCRPQNDFLVYKDDVPNTTSSSYNYAVSTSYIRNTNADQKPPLLHLLKSAFVHVDKIPALIEYDFEKAECQLTFISPAIIRERLVGLNTQILPKHPLSVEESIFEKVNNVRTVLEYCLKEATSKESEEVELEDLPLCALADSTVTTFHNANPRFLTKYTDFFPTKEFLFVHKGLFYTLKDKRVKKGCTLSFRLDQFHELLLECSSGELQNREMPVPFSKNGEVSHGWIKNFWAFVCSLRDPNKDHDHIVDLDLLENWSFIFAERNGVDYLLPIKFRKHVLLLAIGTGHLNEILRQHQVYQPKGNDFYHKDKIKLIFGRSDCVDDLINGLHLAGGPGISFKCDEANTILSHFSHHFKEIGYPEREKIKLMQLFQKFDGSMTDVTHSSTKMLPSGIPADGISILQERTACIFLSHKSHLEELYKNLGIPCINWITFYSQILLRHTENLSNEDMKKHLVYLRSRIQMMGFDNVEIFPVIQQLKQTRLFPSRDGVKRLCSEMFNPNDEVFMKMLTDDKFPSEEYCTYEWLPLLFKLGVVEEVDQTLFAHFCKQLEVTNDLEKLSRVSKILCQKLQNKPFNDDLFLHKISGYMFIVPAVVNTNCSNIYKSLNSTTDRICFRGSCNHAAETLVWTGKFILPTYSTNYLDKRTLNSLGVVTKDNLNLDVVLSNLKNIIVIASGNFDKRTTTYLRIKEYLRDPYSKVLKDFYTFSKGSYYDFKSNFKNLSCIIVQGGSGLEVPRRAVLQEEELTIHPYLNFVPVVLGQYFDLFESMGCPNKVTVNQLADVLQQVYIISKGSVLGPNEQKDTTKAVCFLSNKLEKERGGSSWDDESSEILYLPTITFTDQKIVKLTLSSNSLYMDDMHLEDRLKKFDAPLVFPEYDPTLDANKMVNKNLMSYLPEARRPKILSQSLKEVLAGSNKEVEERVGSDHVSNMVKKRIQHPVFIDCIKRLHFHENIEPDDVCKCLMNVKVYVKRKIETNLQYKGNVIEGSQTSKPMHFNVDTTLGFAILEIYFGLEATAGPVLFSDVASGLLRILGNKLTNNDAIMAVPLLLSEDLNKLPEFLDLKNISRDKTSIRSLGTLPIPGEPVPKELYEMLRPDFSTFEIGDYVAVEISESEDEELQFYYAIFKRHDPNPEVSKRKYGLQTTEDEDLVEEIAACLVYKFERSFLNNDNEGDDALAVSLDFLVDFKDKSFEEIKDEIRRLFKSLKTEDEKTIKRVLRRLYLSWHPDKHPKQTKELATKVFQFIQEELRKLNEKNIIDIDEWDREASRFWPFYSRYRSNYRSRYSSGSSNSFYTPPTFHTFNPQPAVARRWWKQAQYDVEASEHAYNTSSRNYEWICYMAHQGAEKAIKAARYRDHYERLMSHDLTTLALSAPCNGALELSTPDSGLLDNARELQRITRSAESMRYPDCWARSIPHDQYSQTDAEKAKNLARKIVDMVGSMVH